MACISPTPRAASDRQLRTDAETDPPSPRPPLRVSALRLISIARVPCPDATLVMRGVKEGNRTVTSQPRGPPAAGLNRESAPCRSTRFSVPCPSFCCSGPCPGSRSRPSSIPGSRGSKTRRCAGVLGGRGGGHRAGAPSAPRRLHAGHGHTRPGGADRGRAGPSAADATAAGIPRGTTPRARAGGSPSSRWSRGWC